MSDHFAGLEREKVDVGTAPRATNVDQARCQRQPSAVRATPATQKQLGCSATPVTQKQRGCRQVTRLPRKVPHAKATRATQENVDVCEGYV